MLILEVGLGQRPLPGARGVVVAANADAGDQDEHDVSRTRAGADVQS